MLNNRALLFYGIILDGEVTWAEDWKERVMEANKFHPPTGKFIGNEVRWKEYWEKKDKLIKEGGVVLECFGSDSFSYALVVKDSLFIATRNFPELVDGLSKGKDWDAKLLNFCKKLDIVYKEPKWYLVSYAEVV